MAPPNNRQPGQSLSAQDVEALEEAARVEPVEAAEDVDIDQWLSDQARAAQQVDHVEIDGKRIRITVVTEGEENRLLRSSRRPNPQKPSEMKVDPLVYRREYVALSLTKANGRTVVAETLVHLPPGTLTKLQNAIQALSKYEPAERQQPDPFAFLT